MDLTQLLLDLVAKYPVLASIVGVVGLLRLIIKPIMVALKSIVESTETPKDNELLVKVEESKIYKAVIFLLDYLASIKVPPKK